MSLPIKSSTRSVGHFLSERLNTGFNLLLSTALFQADAYANASRALFCAEKSYLFNPKHSYLPITSPSAPTEEYSGGEIRTERVDVFFTKYISNGVVHVKFFTRLQYSRKKSAKYKNFTTSESVIKVMRNKAERHGRILLLAVRVKRSCFL